MRNFIVLTTAVLMVAVSAGAADAQTAELKPSFADAGMPSRPLMQAAVREVARLKSPRANAASPAQTARDDNRGWVERHPVWTGAIAGAGAGAVIGAASCSKSCFPIGKSGAAIVGAGSGAGIGVLIGWAIGAAD